MDDLSFPFEQALVWFTHESETPYVLVRVSEEHTKAWSAALGVPVRRCYVTDALLEERTKALGVPKSQILAAKLPDSGSIMAGDFGEIIVYFYQAAMQHPREAFGPKKWRLKQDRMKPAPHSDVIHFVLPCWPTPSAEDILLCSEVKTKSTNGGSTPITEAIADCKKCRVVVPGMLSCRHRGQKTEVRRRETTVRVPIATWSLRSFRSQRIRPQ
jgi:hypothetical protein